ncbi:39223_t:CDS:2 [Gigaspora margarita]|uniref:39223_t:CDS:1 n=1 Tax=Gigaspora margarita TaxID=4874 RepID=A0ABN7UA46_GIGMA|nr:39223_t:CDS:2 [Gigaspora margarita]
MNQLQIKATILDIELKSDKNHNPYFRLSLAGMPARYFYAFSFSLKEETLQLLQTPINFINRQVLITYQELPNKNHQGTFFKEDPKEQYVCPKFQQHQAEYEEQEL